MRFLILLLATGCQAHAQHIYTYGTKPKVPPVIIHESLADVRRDCQSRTAYCCGHLGSSIIYISNPYCLLHEWAHYYVCGADEKCAQQYDWREPN